MGRVCFRLTFNMPSVRRPFGKGGREAQITRKSECIAEPMQCEQNPFFTNLEGLKSSFNIYIKF